MRSVAITLALALAGACGNSSQVGACGAANQECCHFPDDTFGCNVPDVLPNPNALTCQGFKNGANYCLPCGENGEACCGGVSACEAGLMCVGPYPGAATGGFCRPQP